MPRTSILIAILFSIVGGAVAASAAVSPPTATATFGAATIQIGTTTTLTYTITNPAGNAAELSGVGFTDTLPAGLLVAAGGVMGSCSSGTQAAAAGTSTVTVAGVTLAPGSTCILSVNVVGVAGGSWTNAFIVNSNEGGGSAPVESLVTVALLSLSIEFVPASIPQSGISVAILTITNPNAQPVNTIIQGSALPAGLEFATPSNAASSCGGNPAASGTVLSLQSVQINPNSTCVVSAYVTGEAPGTFTYTTSVLGSNTTSAALTVSSTASPGPQNFQEIGVFRNANASGLFILEKTRTYSFAPGDIVTSFGLAGDRPVAGDWLGSGTVSIGVFRCPAGAAACQWFIDANNNGTWDGVAGGDAIWTFGIPGDLPVVGDWTGDGTSKIGVMRCNVSPCQWILDAGNHHTFDATARFVSFGLAGDLPVVNNWNGVPGADQVGVFRGGQWIVDSNGNGTFDAGDAIYAYGEPGDVPIVGNWFGTGRRRIGVFRPNFSIFSGSAVVILNLSGSNSWTGPPSDFIGSFGLPGDMPVVGLWTLP